MSERNQAVYCNHHKFQKIDSHSTEDRQNVWDWISHKKLASIATKRNSLKTCLGDQKPLLDPNLSAQWLCFSWSDQKILNTLIKCNAKSQRM